MPHTVAPTLEIGYEESGPDDGPPVILLHGWPSDRTSGWQDIPHNL
jgi:pimeloyl-ACP methyl ester carboxylesterase